jgi:O-antigen/teichoic acid export membrane protein
MVSLGRVTYYGGAALLQVVGGLLYRATEGTFLLAQFAAASAAILILFPYREAAAWTLAQRRQLRSVLPEISRVTRIYEKFPKYQMPAQFLNSVSYQLPLIVMRVAFSDVWAGWYFIAYRALAAPATLLAQAVGQVYYRDSAERERLGREQAKAFEDVVYGLIRISLIPSVAVGVIAPFLGSVVLPPTWQPVVPIAQILLIGVVIGFVTGPVSSMLNVKGRQAGALGLNLLLLTARIAALLFGWAARSEILTIWAYSLATAAVMLLYFRYVVQSLDGSMRAILNRVLPLLVDAGLLLTATAVLFRLGFLETLHGTVIIVVLAALLMGWEFTSGRRDMFRPIRG